VPTPAAVAAVPYAMVSTRFAALVTGTRTFTKDSRLGRKEPMRAKAGYVCCVMCGLVCEVGKGSGRQARACGLRGG
jgi:hypothetical protein